MGAVTEQMAEPPGGLQGAARKEPPRWLVPLRLACVSGSGALAATLVLFDRTTPAGVTWLWLGSLALSFTLALVWWTRPSIIRGRFRFAAYEPVSLLWVTVPLVLLAVGLVLAVYLSDEVHGYLYHRLYYRRLLSQSYWPVMLMAGLFSGCCLVWIGRELLLRIGAGARPRDALIATLSGAASLLPIGSIAIGLLLATVSLSMINVNFWRYWATADGWIAIGHYPATLTDAFQFEKGGVSRYFISFPLLPSMLVVSFGLLGHNTLAALLPIILGSALLPLAMFLAVRRVTGSALLGFLFSGLTATFPLLRNYTLNVAEADGLLMTALLLAAYFNVRGSGVGGWRLAVGGQGSGVGDRRNPPLPAGEGRTNPPLPAGEGWGEGPGGGQSTEGGNGDPGNPLSASPGPRIPASAILAGLFAGVASLARPEGILYVGAMYLAALKWRWREQSFWLSVLVWGLMVAAFSGVLLREFGMLWPGNHSGTIKLSNFADTLSIVQGARVFSLYALAFGISEGALAVLIVLVLALVVLCAVQMLRKDPTLIYMPVAALGNVVMVLFVGPIPAEAAKFHDFFRHVSYGFPFLAVTLAYGVGEVFRRLRGREGSIVRYMVMAGLAMLVLAQLSLLEGPVTPVTPTRSPLMPPDVHVTAPELLVDPYPLPVMRFRLSESRYVPDAEEYMAVYPDDVNRYYAPADVRRFDNPADYYAAARALFLGFLALGLVSAAVARVTRPLF